MLALLAVWIALGAFLTTLTVVAFPWAGAESVVTLLPYTIALSATFAAATLWAFRQRRPDEPGVSARRMQAFAAIALNGLSFAVLLFALQDPQYAVLGLAIEIGFLWICWKGYKRIVMRE